MKKIDEIKARRQQRFFERRMAKAKAKKRQDVENELLKHADLIGDAKVKAFIMKKREQKLKERQDRYEKEATAAAKKQGVMGKDVDMLMEDSEEESVEEVKVVQTVKKTKAIKKK